MLEGETPGLSLCYQSGNIRKQQKIVTLNKSGIKKNNKLLLPLLKYATERLYFYHHRHMRYKKLTVKTVDKDKVLYNHLNKKKQ